MPFKDELAKQRELFLLELERRERDILLRMAAEYNAITTRLRAIVVTNTARIAELQAAGEEISASRLFQDHRTRALLTQAQREYAAWAAEAADKTVALKQEAITIATQAVRRELHTLIPGRTELSFAQLPKEAIKQIIAQTVEGGKLDDIFARIAPKVKDKITTALITGLAAGENPVSVGTRAAREASFGLSRGITIARTEMMGAYRRAHTANYRVNDDIIKGWRWVASPDACDFCEGMDGSEHDLDEEMDTHPNCRCTEAPILKTKAEIAEDEAEEEAELEEEGA